MAFATRPVRAAAVLIAAMLATGCATARQRVTVDVVGDVPTHDARGKRLRGSKAAETRTVVVVAAFPCPPGTVDRHRQCPSAPPRRVAIEPLVRHLGPPPTPAEVAARMTSGYPRDPERRAEVRRAYEENVRTRYRLYAAHVSQALRDADWVEIPAADGTLQRFDRSRIEDGLERALLALADRWADDTWARFEPGWPRRKARRQPSPPAAPVPAVDEPKAAAPPGVSADGDLCRQGCQLRWRACLARCRTTPVEGGAYDACTYECGAVDSDCRNGCRTGG